MRKTLLWFVVIVTVLILGLAAYYFGGGQREHLIKGVPYWGIYTGTEMNSSHAFAAYTILQYWGDDRFTPLDIARTFPSELGGVGEAALGDFFRENGYTVENINASAPSATFEHLEREIPLAAPLRLRPTDSQESSVYRVVIGYSIPKKTIIVHDNLYGNNAEIPFEQWEAMRATMSPLLAVNPTDELRDSLKGPNRSFEYPPRSAAMESESMHRIVTNWFMMNALRERYTKTGEPTGNGMAMLGEEMLVEEDFEKLHPAARMQISLSLAGLYSSTLGNHERALEILNTVTLPLLGTDFSQPFGDWERRINPEVYKAPLWTSQPWVLLGLVHERMGDFDQAREAFMKAVEANPSDTDAQQHLQSV